MISGKNEAKCAPKELEILREMSTLSANIYNLSENCKQLSDRLTPILSVTPETASKDCCAEGTMCEHASQIRRCTTDVGRINELVLYLLSNLQL
jgi:hypothetical protein